MLKLCFIDDKLVAVQREKTQDSDSLPHNYTTGNCNHNHKILSEYISPRWDSLSFQGGTKGLAALSEQMVETESEKQ